MLYAKLALMLTAIAWLIDPLHTTIYEPVFALITAFILLYEEYQTAKGKS